jgi:hypothetical protein
MLIAVKPFFNLVLDSVIRYSEWNKRKLDKIILRNRIIFLSELFDLLRFTLSKSNFILQQIQI